MNLPSQPSHHNLQLPMTISGRQRGTLTTLLSRPSPYANETGSLPIGEFDYASSSSSSSGLRNAKILVVGAGGLGCEILKDLAMCDGVFRDVDVIDLGRYYIVALFKEGGEGCCVRLIDIK